MVSLRESCGIKLLLPMSSFLGIVGAQVVSSCLQHWYIYLSHMHVQIIFGQSVDGGIMRIVGNQVCYILFADN